MNAVKRAILLFGCAVIAASAPLVAAAPASATCPYGTAQTRFDGVCTKSGSSGPAYLPPAASRPSADVVLNPNGFSTVNGIPCTPERIGKCYALQESQGG
ncbi:hypothetical protein GCM10023114_41440 [Mycolicibacterium sediminis]|uniref:Intersectin-EH binding protein Ibp1 n=1 Tax=Mycolicibacterium sediminis TaxID=1286180 RepID=A0A7I7QVC8_9MYCO|nr:hypothetical protein MSEDJ_43470 [Mycolicibacterium sediminis]